MRKIKEKKNIGNLMGFWHRLATPTGFPEAELQSLPDIYPKLGLVIYLYYINRVVLYSIIHTGAKVHFLSRVTNLNFRAQNPDFDFKIGQKFTFLPKFN